MSSSLTAYRSRLIRVAIAEVGLILAYIAVPIRSVSVPTALVLSLLVVGLALGVATTRGRMIPGSESPVLDAAIAVSLMLVLLMIGFSTIYFSMAVHGDGFSGLRTKVDAVYFTVTTLSTVGFGDIVPRSQTARMLVTIQIVFDLTVVAVSVRLLLGVAQKHKESRDRASTDDTVR